MLVLTRKLMEKLFIGDDICVTVVRLEGGQVRLGIEAPRNISVVRAELVPERQAASQRPAVARTPRSPHHPVAEPGPAPTGRDLRTPQAGARENDTPRRERSR